MAAAAAEVDWGQRVVLMLRALAAQHGADPRQWPTARAAFDATRASLGTPLVCSSSELLWHCKKAGAVVVSQTGISWRPQRIATLLGSGPVGPQARCTQAAKVAHAGLAVA